MLEIYEYITPLLSYARNERQKQQLVTQQEGLRDKPVLPLRHRIGCVPKLLKFDRNRLGITALETGISSTL